MSIKDILSIFCDDLDHKAEELDCEYISAGNLSDVRERATNHGWTTNGKKGKKERWHCSGSNTPWCQTPCGRPVTTVLMPSDSRTKSVKTA